MDNCNKGDRFKSIDSNIARNTEDIGKLENRVTTLEVNDRGMEEVVRNLEKYVEKIAKSIDKSKWWIITGIATPILITIISAIILSKLNL